MPMPVLDLDAECLRALSKDQRLLPEALVQGRHVFLTGRAGSGKSFTIAAVLEALREAGTEYGICAASGIAAAPGWHNPALLCGLEG